MASKTTGDSVILDPSRFTVDGGRGLEDLLARLCEDAGRRVKVIGGAKLEGLALGGGYGRGEGGVLNEGGNQKLYNDLEFYVFLKGPPLINQRRFGGALHRLERDLTERHGLEIEFKLSSLRRLRGRPVSMFTYDLVMGHKWIVGDDSLLAGCEHHRVAKNIPLSEAARLLMNRCSGLLFAQERLRRTSFGAEEADFSGRNIAKAQLALGDAALVVAGLYHGSAQERRRRLSRVEPSEAPPNWDQVREWHERAVEFKLHPHRSVVTRDELRREWQAVSRVAGSVWLWLENLRLGTRFASPLDYALSEVDKRPESPGWRNRLITARSFGVREALRGESRRYPGTRLFETFPILLWKEEELGNARPLRHVQRRLLTGAPDWADLVAAYERVWGRFNH